MALKRMAGLAAACLIAAAMLQAQTVVKVGQGGTGSTTAAGARQQIGAAAEVHSHALSDLNGVTSKNGSTGILQTFGGGAAGDGECARFDALGNLVSAGQPCGGRENFSQSFTSVQTVVLTHNLGTENVILACFDTANIRVEPDVMAVLNVNSVSVTFAVAQSGRCVVSGNAGGPVQGGGGSVTSVFGRVGTISATAGDYTFPLIGGVAGMTQGGTNQTAWTAGRCVQVSADGTKLESASAACGTGGGAVTSVFGRSGAVTAQSGDYSFSQVAGTATVSQGGTGATSASTARVNLLPSYSGQAGKCLKVTGIASDVEWGDCGTGGGGSVTAGAGIVVNGSVVSVDPATVPTFLTAAATLSGWAGGTIAAQSCQERNISLPGTIAGDAVAPGWPADLSNGLVGTMYATSADTVVVRLCNVTTSGVAAPEGRSFKATILRSF